MSDVFISYANSDRERARELANALSARGWSVWWDRNIKAGQAFDEVIEHELEAAKNIVVLWSRASIASEWVKNEAAVAAQRRVLVPALLDDVKIPLEFRRKQTADLIGWEGDPSHVGLLALFDALQRDRSERVAPTSTPPRGPARQIRPWMAPGATGFVLGCLVTYLAVGRSAYFEREATPTRDPAAAGASSSSLASTKLREPFVAKGQGTKASLPANLPTSYKGVFVDIVGFEKAGELTTVEWIVRNTSDERLTVCNHAYQAQLIDQVSGESWRALHTGGPAAGCETLPGGGQSGAWAKFKLANLENRRLSLSLPSLHKAPELPLPQGSAR
jgi:hypothetical protein